MHRTLSLFNWSFKKAIATLPDSFSRAKVQIIYTILLIAVLKCVVVFYFAFCAEQWLQLSRAAIGLAAYIILLKLVLSYPGHIKLFAHIMLIAGLVLIWSNAIVYIHKTNLPTLQFAFMVILSSFYILGNRAGFVYSVIAVLPFIIFSFTGGSAAVNKSPEELVSPGFEILTSLNFLTIVIAHYFFYKAFNENIHEKENLNIQLQLTAAEAKQLAQSRSDFLATMSHELRTPLNSVVGVTELLLKDEPEERQKENLDILRYSASDLLSLINNILDINKLESNKLQLENTPFSLYQLMNNICSVLKIKARDKQLDLKLDIDEPLKKITVTSDPTRLSQVMYNLIGNAIKFTEKGSVTISVQLIEQSKNTAVVLFSIQDTGIGIPQNRQQVIFESFKQAEPNTTRKYGGTGLGLSIVKQVLALFDSFIQLESTTDKGSRFFFTMMFNTTFQNKESLSLDKATGDLGDLKILVAEDNDINKLVLQKQLYNLNITAVMVADGKKAYDAWLKDDYDAVLLDLDMPEWSGYDTVNEIRAYTLPRKTEAYLIAFTASVSEQQHIIASGFDDHLYKPVTMAALTEVLEKVALRKKLPNLT